MEKNFIHRLPGRGRDDRLIGVISLSDIATKTKNDALCGHILARVSAA